MTEFKVVYDRKNCIGAGSCAVVDPERFFMDDDGKATLKGSSKDADGNDVLEFESNDNKVVEAAQACPVNVIHVYNKKTGEKLV